MPEHPWIQLVAVQMKLELEAYFSREAFAAKIGEIMDKVYRTIDPGVPALVVFPEDAGLMLVLAGMEKRLRRAAGIARGIEAAVRALFFPALYHRVRHRLQWVPALFYTRRKAIASSYFDVFSNAARSCGVYLVAGSVLLPPFAVEDGRVAWWRRPLAPALHNTAFLFGPDGKVIGKQDKVHLIELEREEALHLDPGSLSSLRVYETELGRLGIAICLDGFQDPVVEALEEQGADILVQPSANPKPWSPEQQWDWLNGSYRRVAVERRFRYAVNPMMTGSIWELEFYGQSAIVAQEGAAGGPALGYAALGPMPGFLAVAGSDSAEEIVAVKVPHPRRQSSTVTDSPS